MKTDPTPSTRWRIPLLGLIVVLAGTAAYYNSFQGPFIFDDSLSIAHNPSIRHLWTALNPVLGDMTPSGRPVLNFSLALSYALSGTEVWGYHALNLVIHCLAGLVVFGVVRRTLLRPVLHRQFGADAAPLALAVAVLWTVHPLQTESVTYIVQRAESLMGLFYLLTFYCFVRSLDSTAPRRWLGLGFTSCLLGMGTKEVMASAPLLVLIYDRTFAAGSFREAWQQRRRFYLGLAGTWLLLGALVISGGGNRAGSTANVNFWVYALTQFEAVVRYLWLSVWPHPLIFYYGAIWVQHPLEVLPYALIVTALAAGTLIALWRRPVLGFAGAWFFAILAPTSLIPGGGQTIAEHRMYLPLAVVLLLLVLGWYRLAGRRALLVCLVPAVGLGWATVRRNATYRTEAALWSDTLAKRPSNPYAHNNVGAVLFKAGKYEQSIAEYRESLRLKPANPETNFNLGEALMSVGRTEEAIDRYNEALRLKPGFAWAHQKLANALADSGRLAEALPHYAAALRYQPYYPEAQRDWANALADAGQDQEAIDHYNEALRLDPEMADARNNLAKVLSRGGRTAEAITQLEAALHLKPDYAQARMNLGVILITNGRTGEGLGQLVEAVRLQPGLAEARYNLANAYIQTSQLEKAAEQYTELLKIAPEYPGARENLAKIETYLASQRTRSP